MATPKKPGKSATSTARVKTRSVADTSPNSNGSEDTLPYAVVYIHGIGKQDPPEVARTNWDTALFGHAMRDTAMAYWADIRHPVQTDAVRVRALQRSAETLGTSEARQFMGELEAQIRKGMGASAPGGNYRPEVFSMFPGVGDALLEWITKGFLKDTAAYFFDPTQKKAMQDRLVSVLDQRAGKPIVLIAHSQGTIISYDVLRKLNGKTPSGKKLDIALFVTIGSPLGIDEIQRKLTQPLEVPPGIRAWSNFADPLDPVALDKTLNGEFEGEVKIEDALVNNPVFLQPHSAVGYLSTLPVRKAVFSELGLNQLSYGSRIRKDVLSDMIQDLGRKELDEDAAGAQARYPVLLELRDAAGFGDAARAGLKSNAKLKTLDQHRNEVSGYLSELVGNDKAACIDPLKRFVAARLTPPEIQTAEQGCNASVYCVWKNTQKKALIARSGDVIQVPAARIAYKADGNGINWAVLDTGVASNHPHFSKHKNIAAAWNCTEPGPVVSLLENKSGTRDAEGHGTHVCGIIAGEYKDHVGMAPKARLHVYKVLSDEGSGDDSWIIKAIDHIAETNNNSAELAIHGVNLSLGGAFNPEVYGCGHSPICQELGRLWRQGVVVCIACGNEGAIDIWTPNGAQTLNTSLSIGDPANLEDCLAVGSIHADHPHTYGVSYFSSHGPTADGRGKPDIVAPGERISSCNAHFKANDAGSLYVSLSGTSMAAPHVSGLVASFLSVRREFQGRPDEVKKILLSNCTDLQRDRYIQGAGMPNLVKMLANT